MNHPLPFRLYLHWRWLRPNTSPPIRYCAILRLTTTTWIALLLAPLTCFACGSSIRVAQAHPQLIMYIACPSGPASSALMNSLPGASQTPCFTANQTGGTFVVAGQYKGPAVTISPGTVIHVYQAVSSSGATYSFQYLHGVPRLPYCLTELVMS